MNLNTILYMCVGLTVTTICYYNKTIILMSGKKKSNGLKSLPKINMINRQFPTGNT